MLEIRRKDNHVPGFGNDLDRLRLKNTVSGGAEKLKITFFRICRGRYVVATAQERRQMCVPRRLVVKHLFGLHMRPTER